jgi:signal transduction histidine kinase
MNFYKLIICALKAFQLERNKERLKIKEVKREDARIKKLKAKFSEIESILEKENVTKTSRDKIHEHVFEIQKEISDVIDDAEEPLIVAASIGLTYMIPTHEAERDIQESYKVLMRILKSKEPEPHQKIKIVVEQLQHAEDILQGLVKLSQSSKKERFYINEPIDFAIKLMKPKIIRNEISIETDIKVKKSVIGASRLFSIVLLNMIDNSIFWQRNNHGDKKIKITFADYSKKFYCLIVSDNGPGLTDDIDFLSRPFVTRKSKGMGLGLYICDRVAIMHKGKLISLNEFEFPGLLSGANIALLIPKID